MTVRNVRFYTSRNLVPPPIRRGRSGYYSAEHVARLELVRELQAHGFTLAAIEQYLAGIPDSATPADIALRRTMLAPWHSDRPVRMTRAELSGRADRELTDADLEILDALRIASPRDDGDLDVSTTLLSIGLELLDLGFPPDAARAAAEVYEEHGRQIATELFDVFRRKAWPAFKEAGYTPETIQRVVEQLKPMSIASLVAAYEQGMDATRLASIEPRPR
ncbi:MAG: MerR family transcriptional regulator [Nocardioides sp.]|nr:MerR family transcriptional regulator [Nocardioides sp.]